MDRSLSRPTDDIISSPSVESVPVSGVKRDQLEPTRGATLLGVAAALAFHVAFIGLSPREAARAAVPVTVEIELFEAPPAPELPLEPEEPPPKAEEPVAAMVVPVERRRLPEPVLAKKEAAPPPKAEEDVPPPSAAPAAVAEQPEKLSEPAPALVAAEGAGDSSHSIVQSATGALGGRGLTGAGVVGGTGTGAAGSKQGVVGGTGTGTAVPVTLSLKDWRCAWPEEAEYEDFDQQVVSLRVVVAEDGRVESAEIVKDPGFGFGRAARDCARRVRFNPAKDASGRAVRAASPPINVRFVR